MPDNLDPTRVISVKGVHRLRRESGVTLLMVAVGMFALLSMAILSLDVVNLYMSSNQAQKTADAAALAGAEALASSGTTSGAVPLNSVCNGSNGDADLRAQAVAAQNAIAGLPPTTVTTACSSTAPHYNPQIQVTVTRSGVPTFLAQMWGHTSSTVSATALAEAYNPSFDPANPSVNRPPIAIHGIKPWLLYNNCSTISCNPLPWCSVCPPQPFFFNLDYSIHNPGNLIGQQWTLTLIPSSTALPTSPPLSPPPSTIQFYALDGPAPIACPSTSSVSCGGPSNLSLNYQDNIACENGSSFSNGQFVGPGQVFQVDTRSAANGSSLQQETIAGTECLIHAGNTGTGQDIFTGFPVTITGGSNNPNVSLRSVNGINRSDSVVTVPVFDCPAGGCNATPQLQQLPIVGFLQLGIKDVVIDTTTGTCSPSSPCTDIDAFILNAAGVDLASTGTPITGAGTSPVPVRLIQ